MPTTIIEVIDVGPVGPPGNTMVFPFSKPGVLSAPYTTPFRFYVPFTSTLSKAQLSVGTPPTGTALIVDVLKNGTSIYMDPLDRLTVQVGNNAGSGGIVSGTFTTTDYLQVMVAQVGSVVPGFDLLVQLSLSRA